MSNMRELEKQLAQGSIDRREFLHRAAVIGVVGGVPALLTESAQAMTPKKGGRLRMGIADGSTSDSLVPEESSTMMTAVVEQGQIGNNLVEVDADGVPQLELAESFESTPDAAKWVFKLRKGIEFHNGKSLESEDVVYSINHHRGADTKSGAKGVMGGIVDIKTDGKHTVIFELSGGSADFPFIMSDFHLQIFPSAPWVRRSSTRASRPVPTCSRTGTRACAASPSAARTTGRRVAPTLTRSRPSSSPTTTRARARCRPVQSTS